MNESLTHIFLDAFLINNFVLCVFLGMCSFLGLSGKFATAWRMGVSVMFVITVSSVLSFGTNLLLVRFHAEYLRIIVYIVIIAATVQLTEMFIRKNSPALFRELGVYLPLITTNCAVLAVPLFQTSRNYSLVQSDGVRRRRRRRILRGPDSSVARSRTHGYWRTFRNWRVERR